MESSGPRSSTGTAHQAHLFPGEGNPVAETCKPSPGSSSSGEVASAFEASSSLGLLEHCRPLLPSLKPARKKNVPRKFCGDPAGNSPRGPPPQGPGRLSCADSAHEGPLPAAFWLGFCLSEALTGNPRVAGGGGSVSFPASASLPFLQWLSSCT